MPECERSTGCPIGEDLAGDLDVQNFLAEFLRAKNLYEINGISSISERTFERIGLLDEPEYLIKLEDFYLRLKNKKQNDAKPS